MLRALRAHDVEFIVVGGVCAALHGSPVITQDLNIVQARTAENLRRLENAKAEFGDGLVVQMLDLPTLIATKRALGGRRICWRCYISNK